MAALNRHTTFRFTLRPTPAQEATLRRHVGAARFGFNQCLRIVRDALDAKAQGADTKVPWSGFDLINAFNAWKRSEAAGIDDNGRPGLPWRGEVCQQVFEEAAVDLGRALTTFSADRRAGRRRGFPAFKKKSQSRPSFRMRNKATGKKSAIRFGDDGGARCSTLPKLGALAVREDTRRLRRMLAKDRARILFATVSVRNGRWTVALNVEAAPLHPDACHTPTHADVVGVDRGLTTFAVVADASGNEVERIDSPRPLRGSLRKLRRASRRLSRKQKGSRNRRRQRARLSRLYERITHVRNDFVHRASSRLAKTQRHLVIEDLCTAGLMRTRLARSIADSAWARFATQLGYKTSWRGATLTRAHRFYPSTRRCSACGDVGPRMSLSKRVFLCSRCGHEADRDTNAAVCLAQWPQVAAKHAETQNACGEMSAGEQGFLARETRLDEAGRASARRPRRAVLVVKTVNTL